MKLLLNSIGSTNFNTIAALSAPKLPNELSYDELIKLLKAHMSPKQNVLVMQHQLSKYQSDNQTIADYVADLRTDIGDCNASVKSQFQIFSCEHSLFEELKTTTSANDCFNWKNCPNSTVL